jgi:hypothetical protein
MQWDSIQPYTFGLHRRLSTKSRKKAGGRAIEIGNLRPRQFSFMPTSNALAHIAHLVTHTSLDGINNA